MCSPSPEPSGNHHSAIRAFLSDLLSIVQRVRLFLSLLRALPPPTSSHPFPSPLPRHVLSFEVLTSERCIIQESAPHRTHTFMGHAHAPCLCGLAVYCRLFAERDKLSGSHFSERVRILVDDFFHPCVYLSAVLMSVRDVRVIEALWHSSSFSL